MAHGLTRSEMERLALLIEECGEVIQASTKILRHGYSSTHPRRTTVDNRTSLRREAVDLALAIHLLVDNEDIDPITVTDMTRALKRKRKYLHYRHKWV